MTNDTPLSTMSRWAMVLTEPLLSLSQRARLEDDLAALHHRDPDTVHMFFAGLVSDLSQTLPDKDPWCHLSGRAGKACYGPNPPGDMGASTAAGAPFGTWTDAVDVLPLTFATVDDDPQLCALAGGLEPDAAAILGAGATGWRGCLEVVQEVFETPLACPGSSDAWTAAGYEHGARLNRVRKASSQAVRWLAHRRRAWVGAGDPWPAESAFRWAWRAARTADGRTWDEADVTRALLAERLVMPYPPPTLDDEF